MMTNVTISTTYDPTTHGAVSRLAFHAAPSPPTMRARSPTYITWFARLDRPRSAATTSRLGSWRTRNATNIATPWHITNTMRPSRCRATSHWYTRDLLGQWGTPSDR